MGQFDAVIVGASLAGLNAAYYAAREGNEVLVLERNASAGCDVRCAEGVVEDILSDAEMPVLRPEGIYQDYIATEIREVQFRAWRRRRKPKAYTLRLRHKRGYVLDRAKFEQRLEERAKDAGAKFVYGHAVSPADIDLVHGRINAGPYRTPWFDNLIAADGISSVVGRAAGMTGPLKEKDIGKAVQYTVRIPGEGYRAGVWDENRIDIDWNWRPPGGEPIVGYGWVFPKSTREANVGLGLAGKTPTNMFALLDAYCKATLHCDYTITRRIGKSIPLAQPPAQVVRTFGGFASGEHYTHNVMLTGDASRACLAHLGAGIGAALISGRMAGQAVSTNVRYYQAWYDQNWRPRAEKAWRAKERLWENPSALLRWAPLLLLVHRIAPRWTEERAFRSMRYTAMT